jgi:hypothetical protein
MGMIIVLLLLIVLILLFGASAVRGWLSKAATIIFGGALFVAVALVIISWFGETGLWVTFYGVAGLLLVGSLAVRVSDVSAKQRGLRAKKAWDEWEEKNRKPEIKFGETTLSKAEKKRMKRQALGRPDR